MSKQFFLIVTCIVSVYIAAGGMAEAIIYKQYEIAQTLPESPIVSDQTEYRNIAEQKAIEDQIALYSIYPLNSKLPDSIVYLVTLASFGFIGSLIRILVKSINSKKKLEAKNIYALSALGSILGLTSLIIMEILPEFKYEAGSDEMNFAIALLLGMFSIEIYNKLKSKIED